jgi:hypothetical protein
MITLVYFTPVAERDSELDWLREQKIFPACEPYWDWDTGVQMFKFGAIVSPEAALAIKLRHQLQFQKDYKQR